MAEHLVVSLSAALASFGDLAGHERRGGLSWPGRSALLGLAGAALGVRRDDAEGWKRLDALKLAVAVYEDGAPLRDFHTAQSISAKAPWKRPDTRTAAFAEARPEDIHTTITLRDYRVGSLFAAAWWGDAALLAELEEAFRRPVFTLYLGRKSCPLNAPLAPRRVEAEDVRAAFARHAPHSAFWREGRRDGSGPACWRPRLRHIVLSAEDAPEGAGLWTESRHDAPVDRGKWHFAARSSVILPGESA